jgi:hypothetical protein
MARSPCFLWSAADDELVAESNVMHSRRPRCLAQDEPPRLCSRHTLKLQITTNRGRPADAFVGRLTLASRWLWIFLQHRRRCQYLASGFHRRRGRHLGDLQGFEHATIGMLESIAAPFSLFGAVYQRSDNPGRRAGFPGGGGRLEINGARDWHSGCGSVFGRWVVEREDLEDLA